MSKQIRSTTQVMPKDLQLTSNPNITSIDKIKNKIKNNIVQDTKNNKPKNNVNKCINAISQSSSVTSLSSLDTDEPEKDIIDISDVKDFINFFCEKDNISQNFLTKINTSKMTKKMKDQLKQKLSNSKIDNEKNVEWFNSFLSIPFGKYKHPPSNIKNKEIFFKNILSSLDNIIYGNNIAKEEILSYIAQSISSPNSSPRVLALQGDVGTGKTLLVREGISKALDRPVVCFSMGGLKDASQFIGYDYTYNNSKYGSILQALITSKIMNPIIFFDELDKISNTPGGEEIENLLIHLTDPIQNHDFRDKFFGDFPIDLSKVVFIFAFNNIEKINTVLKDRLNIIKIPTPSYNEKIIIAKNYLIDKIIKNTGLSKTDLIIKDEVYDYIIKTEPTIRNIKRSLETICLKVNMIKLLGNSIKLSFVDNNKKYTFPIVIDSSNIDTFLKNDNNDNNNYKSMYT